MMSCFDQMIVLVMPECCVIDQLVEAHVVVNHSIHVVSLACLLILYIPFLVSLNGKRKVLGILRGYDQFLNLVLEETVEIDSATNQSKEIGTVVIRGNSVVTMEPLESV